MIWRGKVYGTLDELHLNVRDLLRHLCPDTIASITGYWFILSALSVAGIY
jgi:hypothetical protein